MVCISTIYFPIAPVAVLSCKRTGLTRIVTMAESIDGKDRTTSDASEDKHLWIKIQKQTFTNWVNDRLKDTGLKVEDLRYQFDDGITLVKLLEVLAHNKKMPK